MMIDRAALREQYRLQQIIDAEFQTRAARGGFLDRFAREADPEGVLPAAERQARAVALRREHMLGLAARSAEVRRERARPNGDAVFRAGTGRRSTSSRAGTGKRASSRRSTSQDRGMGRRGVGGNVWGRWRITGMDLWDRDAVDLLGPAIVDIRPDGAGEMRFVAVEVNLDHRELERDGQPGVEFSWDGHDEASPVSGRGWLVLSEEAKLRGHIWFHKGGDSGFEAHLISGDDSAAT